MKNKQLLICIGIMLASCCWQQANAKIWRVNNKSNYDGATLWGDNYGGTAAYPVFKQLSQAVAFGIVNGGDTVHMEGSTSLYDIATTTKKLVIIGTGYFLADNPATSNTSLTSKIGYIIFNPGSEGSQVIGMDVVNNGSSSSGYVYAYTNDITIKRCRIERGVEFQSLLTDVFILENFFSNTYVTNCLFTNGNSSFVPPTGLVFNNNICQKTLTWGAPVANPTTFWPIAQCNNNVFDGTDNLATPNLAFSTGEFRNNILMPTNAVVNISAMAGVVRNNVGTLSTQFGTANNNIVVPGVTTLFATSASTDGKYQLATGSQASNNGSDGTDRGAFGGTVVTNRYTLSGLAPIPVIYDIITAGVADATGLPVTIKARIVK